MSKIGFYRYKIENASSQVVTLYVNGVASKTKNVIAKDVCVGYRILKYLDKNGQYRFFPFSHNYSITNTAKEIGSTNEIISSLLNERTDKKSVGFETEKKIIVRSKNVSSDELLKLADIYSSPRVYYYVGDGLTDDLKDWILVSIKGDGKSKLDKRNFSTVEITITFPQQYSQTIL